MKKLLILICVFTNFSCELREISSISEYTKSAICISLIGLFIVSLLSYWFYEYKRKKSFKRALSNTDDHAIKVNNRVKMDYLDKCRLLINNFNNHKHNIETKVEETILYSKSKLGYDYPHDIKYDRKSLQRKIDEIKSLNEDNIQDITLEKISSAYYQLNSLIRSYNTLPRNIEIVVSNILKKRKDYDDLLKQARDLYTILVTKYAGKDPNIKKESFDMFVAINNKKENYYDGIMSLILYYEQLIARFKADNNKSKDLALTPVKSITLLEKKEELGWGGES